MPDAVADYLLFLAQGATIVVLAAVLVRVTLPRRPRTRLRVRRINDHYDRLRAQLEQQVLPRRQVRARRRLARTERRAAGRRGAPARPRVFVLDFHGDLRATRVRGLREEVTAVLALATSTDEVVLRLTNPGGTVNDQGLAASQLLRIRQQGVPLTVCVDTVAASGGYLMACVANRIVAAPFAIVGSIGVVSSVPNFYRLLDRLGIDVEQFTGGQFKRTVTMFGQTTEDDRAKVTEQVNEVHGLFKDFVRSHRPQVDLEQVATGEYWYGTDALERNLVDEMCTSDDYLQRAHHRSDLFEVRYLLPTDRRRRLTETARSALTHLNRPTGAADPDPDL